MPIEMAIIRQASAILVGGLHFLVEGAKGRWLLAQRELLFPFTQDDALKLGRERGGVSRRFPYRRNKRHRVGQIRRCWSSPGRLFEVLCHDKSGTPRWQWQVGLGFSFPPGQQPTKADTDACQTSCLSHGTGETFVDRRRHYRIETPQP